MFYGTVGRSTTFKAPSYRSIPVQHQQLKMNTITKAFTVAFALVICFASASKPNPCGFQLNGESAFQCKSSTACAATFGSFRKAFCARLPPNPSCICPKIFKPVCCRVLRPTLDTMIVTEPNSCSCGCRGGVVLFKGKCSAPPSVPARCPRTMLPTCCYIRKFDLTVTASNPCICEQPFGGVRAKPYMCGIQVAPKEN